jgi:hypothetical protein
MTDAAGFLVDAVSVDVSPARPESARTNVAGMSGNP